ncbi:MAG: Sjogren's syndrome/scleroderma autoantigen 1 family protein [Halorubrum sp.]|uniref:Sjogren's syndrome/scleroderma autoantigen 1 family protein n=1 Tax=Halorubrum sp. TaxID=1879286 RepID=UPI0039708CB8
MSDGFDKEAEREKLREKLADDDEKREHTQRMSELLLKGATMTNRHCDDCGDPIFRHGGREFCPTCHTVDAADVENAETAGPAGDPAGTPGTSAAEAVDASDAPSANDEAIGGDRSPTASGGDSPPQTRANGTAVPDSSVGSSDPARAGSPPSADAPTGGSAPSAGAAAGGNATAAGGSGSVADARASLTRTLHRFAVAAEETDDPRRARDHLRAAREAAETLAALDR